MTRLTPDTQAVVAAVDRLTTQARRIADALTLTYDGTPDDSPTTPDDGPRLPPMDPVHILGIDPSAEPGMVVAQWVPEPPGAAEHRTRVQEWAAQAAAPESPPAGIPTVRRWDGERGPGWNWIDGDGSGEKRGILGTIADEDAQCTARRASLRNLLDRLDRSTVHTWEEGNLLRQHVEAEMRDADTARAVAAGNKRHVQLLAPELDDLQARITKARALHASHANGSAECTQRCERPHPEVRVCNGCGWTAPCPTARALDGTEQPTPAATEATEAVMVVDCSGRSLRRVHEPHDWEPQPGMPPVHCPGHRIEEPS